MENLKLEGNLSSNQGEGLVQEKLYYGPKVNATTKMPH